MKLITRDTDYAVRTLCFMAKDRERVIAIPELVKKLKVPKPFLRKILQLLNKKGLLASSKGQGGGFKLNRDPNNIFVTDVIRVFQGQLSINKCMFKKKICPYTRTCALKKKIDGIEKHVVSELKSITIASLLNGK